MSISKFNSTVKTTKGETRNITFIWEYQEILQVVGEDLQEGDVIECLEFPDCFSFPRPGCGPLEFKVFLIGSNVLGSTETEDEGVNPENLLINHKINKIIIGKFIKGLRPGAFENADVDTVEFGFCKNISPNAFSHSSISNLEFNSGVGIIGDYAFFDCNNLTSVSFKSSCECIGRSAFKRCTHLESVEHTGAINTIESFAFSDCKNLKSFIWPESCKVINYKTFEGCESLEEVKVANDTISIYEDFFTTQVHNLDLSKVFYLTLSDDIKENTKLKIIKSLYGCEMAE